MSAYLKKEGLDADTTRTAYDEVGKLDSKYTELAADAALAAGGALPPPAGTAADLVSLGRSLWKADFGGALMDVVGLVPIAGDAAKAGKIANKLNDLRRAIDVANSGLKKALQKTNKAAGKYWDDVAKANRKAYDDAIAKCTGTRECREAAALKKGPQYNNTPKSGKNGEWEGERGDGIWKPSNGGPPIAYKNGFPDYSAHSVVDVDIPMKGNSTDFTAARNAAEDTLKEKFGKNWKNGWKKDYVWHHNENGTTMQLIPKKVHATGQGASTPHMGGASLYDGSNKEAF